MNRFSRKLIGLTEVILVLCAAVSLNAEEKAGWKHLFDGKTLDGWEVHSGFAK